MKGIRSLILAGVLVVFETTPVLQAQTASTSAITGTISDASSGVIAGATITATNTDNGQSRTVSTGADGAYNFGLLPPGTYKITISATGFKQEDVTVTVAVTEVANVSRRLALGSQADAITVEATAAELQTGTSALGTVVSTRIVSALPLTTRNYTDILGLAAGANGSVANAVSLGKGGTNLAVNGASQTQNAFQMDGVSVVPFAAAAIQQKTPSSRPSEFPTRTHFRNSRFRRLCMTPGTAAIRARTSTSLPSPEPIPCTAVHLNSSAIRNSTPRTFLPICRD